MSDFVDNGAQKRYNEGMSQQGNMVTLDFANRPSDRELTYLRNLAREFQGLGRSGFGGDFLKLTWEFQTEALALEFWNRATMFEDYVEGNMPA